MINISSNDDIDMDEPNSHDFAEPGEICCMCLEGAKYEVGAACSHQFCCKLAGQNLYLEAKCIIDYWEVQNAGAGLSVKPVTCPMCRRGISMLFRNFTDEEKTAENLNRQEVKTLLTRISRYNVLFSAERNVKAIGTKPCFDWLFLSIGR